MPSAPFAFSGRRLDQRPAMPVSGWDLAAVAGARRSVAVVASRPTRTTAEAEVSRPTAVVEAEAAAC